MPKNNSVSLFRVMTIDEVSRFFNKHYNTVYQAIQSGRLLARKTIASDPTRGIWLIDEQSVYKLWGADFDQTVYDLHMFQNDRIEE